MADPRCEVEGDDRGSVPKSGGEWLNSWHSRHLPTTLHVAPLDVSCLVSQESECTGVHMMEAGESQVVVWRKIRQASRRLQVSQKL
jgi:hypothetical protein